MTTETGATMTAEPTEREPNELQRLKSISSLVSSRTTEARKAAQDALSDASGLVRHEAAFVLGCIGGPDDIAVLLPALNDPSPFVRHEAALALGRLGSLDHIPALTAGLDDQVPEVAASFEMAIAEIKERGSSMLPAVSTKGVKMEGSNVIERCGEAEGLAPCPFCGAQVQARQIKGAGYSLVGCRNLSCPASAISVIPDQWNTRATIPAIGAAEICAEMAREADAECVTWSTNPELVIRYKGMADALRKAERRIRAQALILLTRIMIRVMESDWPREQRYESLHLLLDQDACLRYMIPRPNESV